MRTSKWFIFRAFTPILAAGWVLLFGTSAASDTRSSLIDQAAGTVVLDPGHGGNDRGAQGPAGTAEKEICLALARQLAIILEPARRVILTRSDDYAVELRQRTALANEHKADILISLHTSASFQHAATGMTIYYFHPSDKSVNAEPKALDAGALPWGQIQMSHIAASRTLASTLQQALERVRGAPPVRVQPAPLALLQGAAMPAVLIEIGYVTNADTERSLTTESRQAAYAQAIAKGIELYMAAAQASGQ